MTELIRQRLKTLPDRPGCYLMRDRRGEIIYIGKAKNLRRRVSSYFRRSADHPPKVRSMVNTVYDFEFMTVKNEAESLLTEAALIKKYKPRFNILMRDDKRYLALRADPDETWPRFTCCRIVREDGAKYFGPFPSAPVVRQAKDFVEKRWGIRECKAIAPDEAQHRHCSADIIRHCSAPCLKRIDEKAYRERFEEACEFLEGKRPQEIEMLMDEMSRASAAGDFERAAAIRDTWLALKEITKAHYVRNLPSLTADSASAALKALAEALGLKHPPAVIECIDISNLFGTNSVASVVTAREGLPDKRYYRHYRIRTVEGADDPRSMAEVVMRRYSKEAPPDLLVCDGGITQLRATRAALKLLDINIPTVGLAEKQEEIVMDPDILRLPRDSPALFVLTRLRDEAHRFAITYHRQLREKAIRESVLDGVHGIGEAKKLKLLRHFKSIAGISKASVEEIAAVAGVSPTVAGEVLRVVSG